MPRPPRIALDSSCFIAYVDRRPTEDEAVLRAIDRTMDQMIRGTIRIVASRVIETEVRPGDLTRTRAFHEQLRACPNFESFGESPGIRTLALELQDRLQNSGRRGHYADLLHVATAIAARSQEFWTTDQKIVRWFESGVITEIPIRRPYLEQDVLEL